MAAVRCPTCGDRWEADMNRLPAFFPFCSERCKLLDLGAWAAEKYRIPGAAGPNEKQEEEEPPKKAES